MSSLFRKQVYDAKLKKSDSLSAVDATMPISWSIITAIVFFFVLALLAFLFFTELARKETARGALRYADAEARIFPETAGILSSCQVSNGDLVKTGQTLVTVTTETYLEAGLTLSDNEISALEEEIASLESRLARADESARIEHRLISAEIDGSTELLQKKSQQLEIDRDRLATALVRQAETARDLEEGLITNNILHARIDDVARMQQSVIRIEAEITDIIATKRINEIRLQKVSIDLAKEQTILAQSITQAQASLSRQNSRKGYALKSPIDGVVTASWCRAGESVALNVALMTVLPKDSYFIGEIFLPTSAIALIEEGQSVHIRYDAFPYQKFGVFKGTISEVSRATSTLSNTSEGPIYQVTITLDVQSVGVGTTDLSLQSGMQLNADIVLEKRRVIGWLIDPFQS